MKGMRRLFFSVLIPVISLLVACPLEAAEKAVIRVTPEERITASLTDLPLRQILDALSSKLPLEIRGSVPDGDRLTVRFVDLTLEEAVHRVMTGFNYVLVKPGEAGGKAILVVMGRVQRQKYDDGIAGGGAQPVAGGAPAKALVSGQPSPMEGVRGDQHPQGPPAASPGQMPAGLPLAPGQTPGPPPQLPLPGSGPQMPGQAGPMQVPGQAPSVAGSAQLTPAQPSQPQAAGQPTPSQTTASAPPPEAPPPTIQPEMPLTADQIAAGSMRPQGTGSQSQGTMPQDTGTPAGEGSAVAPGQSSDASQQPPPAAIYGGRGFRGHATLPSIPGAGPVIPVPGSTLTLPPPQK